jgi:hypothetical protein
MLFQEMIKILRSEEAALSSQAVAQRRRRG